MTRSVDSNNGGLIKMNDCKISREVTIEKTPSIVPEHEINNKSMKMFSSKHDKIGNKKVSRQSYATAASTGKSSSK